jgi:hypothetical protein
MGAPSRPRAARAADLPTWWGGDLTPFDDDHRDVVGGLVDAIG